jgi:hypothetical protein
MSLLLRFQISQCSLFRIWRAVRFHLAVFVVSNGWIQPVPPKHSTKLRGFTLKMFFTVLAWVLHFSFLIFGATRSTSVADVYYPLWRQRSTKKTYIIPSQGNTNRWQMSVRKLLIRSAVSAFERSWNCPTPVLEISLSSPLSYRCETKHGVTSVSLQSPSWLSPRSPRHGKVNSIYLVTRILQDFVKRRYFCARKLWRKENFCPVVVT